AIMISAGIRPVVWAVVPSLVPPIRITVVATIPVAGLTVIATIPVAGLTVIATIPVAIAITTVLRHVAIYATLRICSWSERHRHREREDAHQRQGNDYFLKSSVVHTPPFRAFRRLSWTKNYRTEPRVLHFSIACLVPASPSLGAFKLVVDV